MPVTGMLIWDPITVTMTTKVWHACCWYAATGRRVGTDHLYAHLGWRTCLKTLAVVRFGGWLGLDNRLVKDKKGSWLTLMKRQTLTAGLSWETCVKVYCVTHLSNTPPSTPLLSTALRKEHTTSGTKCWGCMETRGCRNNQ